MKWMPCSQGLQFLLVFLLLFSTLPSLEADPIRLLQSEQTRYTIDNQVTYYEDKTRALSFEEARALQAAGAWQPAPEGGMNFGFSSSAFWTRFTLSNQSAKDVEWLMEFGYPLVDYLDVYTQDSSGAWQKQSYGDLLPFFERPFEYRNITIPLELPPGASRTFYVRMETQSSSQLPIIVQTKDSFIEEVIDDQIRYGLQFGTVLVMVLYNLFVFLVVRDKNYLLYVIAIFGNLSIIASVSGHVFQYIFPTMPLFANQYLLLSLNLSSAGNNLFALYFLNTKRYGKVLHYVHWTYVMVAGALMFSPFVMSYLTAAKLAVPLSFFSTYVLLFSSLWCWYKGNRTAAYFTLAWFAYLIGIQILGVKNFGYLPSNFLTNHAAEIGNVLEVLLLSFAVGDRYRMMRLEKEKAQEETLEAQAESLRIQKELNETLEDKVKARTKELSEAMEELNHTNEELRVTLDRSMEQQVVIRQKNQSITDSIQYAKRIQQSILASRKEFAETFPDSFILFKPRDIVSGDFFFLHRETSSTGAPLVFLAAVDCTGHGVPGALMSMLGNEILKEIIAQAKIYEPAPILEELNRRIRDTLKQNETRIRDGMDISLVVWHPQEQKIQYAGARNPLLYASGGTLQRLRGDRFSIGGELRTKTTGFAQHELSTQDVDAIYLFSDGYQDQFGGKRNRKFSVKRLIKLLEEAQEESCEAQCQQLDEQLRSWMVEGNEVQIDDILVIGVRFNP